MRFAAGCTLNGTEKFQEKLFKTETNLHFVVAKRVHKDIKDPHVFVKKMKISIQQYLFSRAEIFHMEPILFAASLCSDHVQFCMQNQ